MTLEKALSILDTLKKGWYSRPTNYMAKNSFIQQSYSRSAILEIERYILKHKDQDPSYALDDFRKMVDDLACKTGSHIYSIYYDTATDILDTFIIENKPYGYLEGEYHKFY